MPSSDTFFGRFSLLRHWRRRFDQFRKLQSLGSSREGVECFRILEEDYGHQNSCRKKACLDREGHPIPWYTYPAIEYLRQLDFSQKRIFEFGSGNSTLFWCERSKEVTCVEDNPDWFKHVSAIKKPNMDMRLAASQEEYLAALANAPAGYDVIIVDGSHRARCAEVAVQKLNEGGLIILDNADWHPRTAAFLRSRNLLEVDMTGFGPINGYTWTTSLFFHRAFNVAPRLDRQPHNGLGSMHQTGEDQ